MTPDQIPHNRQAFLEAIRYARLPKLSPQWEEISDIITAELQSALILNERTPAEAARDIAAQVNALLEKGRHAAVLWWWIFNDSYGVLNLLLSYLGIDGPNWLGSKTWVLPAFIIMSLWGIGGGMIIYLAGLQGIPTELYEAAELDGAGALAKFFHVTLPMISPVIFFNLIMGIIGSFQVFTTAYVMTNGGPDRATLFYSLNLYNFAFRYHKMGYASALAWILFLIILLLLGGGALMMLPFLWMISSSLKAEEEVYALPIHWLPRPAHWDNYVKALTIMPFHRYLWNTVLITFWNIVGTTLSCSLVAYGFARFRFRGGRGLFVLLLSTMMLPAQVTMIPRFMLFRGLGWIDTFKPLVVPSFFGNAFFIFLLRQFFLTIPRELEDAARIDGCSSWGIYWRIMLPLSKLALATVVIFTFMGSWNDFMGPLIYLNSMENRTLTLALNAFKDLYGNVQVNLLMAASLVVLLPCLILFFLAQRYFIRGIVVTGVKG